MGLFRLPLSIKTLVKWTRT